MRIRDWSSDVCSSDLTGEVSAQVATMEEVGANVTKAFLVGDVGVDKDVGDFSAAAFFGERNRFINEGRGYQDPVRRGFKDQFCLLYKRIFVVQVEKVLFYFYSVLLYFGFGL